MLDKIFFLLSMIIIFYLTIRCLQKFTYSDDTLNGFIIQFQTNFIEEILPLEISQNSSECPSNFKDLIINNNWPGSFSGCGCKSENKYEFYSNFCPKENCLNIEEIQMRNLSNFNKIHLCVKRGEKNYEQLMKNIIPKNNISMCINNTHRICGFIDNLENVLCLNNNLKCPVTNFFISNDFNEVENYKKKDEFCNVFSLNNSNIFVVVSHSDINILPKNKILNIFKVDFSQPCLNLQKSPDSELLFDLIKNRYDLSCDKFKNGSDRLDYLFNFYGKSLYLDYLKDNFFNELYEKIYNVFNINIDNIFINLYAKTFPGWNYNCMKKNDEKTLKNFLISNEILNKLSFYVIIHAFIVITILIGIGICAFYFVNNFEKLFYFSILGFIILNLIYPIQVISNANWIVNNITDKNGNYCGDSSLNIMLKRISESCNSLINCYIVILCITVLNLIIFIFILNAWIKPTIKEIQERLIQLREYA